MRLRVTQAFGGRAVGDEITDASEIEAILDSEQSGYAVKVADPEPDAKPASKTSAE